jgi:four helix bundle protein
MTFEISNPVKQGVSMKYERFEDLPVWKDAISLAVAIYQLTENRLFHQPGDWCGQLRRAALSVSNNIAEGFERGSTAELIVFNYIARGSAGEVRSMLHFAERLPEAKTLEMTTSELRARAESCSRQLRGWTDSLQNSEIRGQRHLNDKSRQQYQSRRRADAFKKQIDGILREARPELFPPAGDDL